MTTNKHQSQDLNLDGYQSLNFDGLARHANYRVIAYREDILHILDKKDAAAIIFQIIYRWLTEKRRDDILSEMETRHKAGQPQLTPQEVEDRMWVYMSYNEFVRESGGAIGYNTVVRTLEYLIQKGVIERRENSNPKFTEYEYRVNKETVRALLKELPTFPYYLSKGAKGKETTTPHTQVGTGTPYPSGVGAYPFGGETHTQVGLGHTHLGVESPPNGYTSQNPTQTIAQEITGVANADSHAPLTFSSEGEMIAYLRSKGATISLPDPSPVPTESTPSPQEEPLILPVPAVSDTKQEDTGKDSSSQQIDAETVEDQGKTGHAPKAMVTKPEPPATSTIVPQAKGGAKPVEGTRKSKAKEAKASRNLLTEASPEAQAAIQEWISIFKKPVAITETLIKHATTLAEYKPDPGEIAACRAWMYKTDAKGWYREHGMHLGDVVREFERFRSLGSVPVPQKSSPPVAPSKRLLTREELKKMPINFYG